MSEYEVQSIFLILLSFYSLNKGVVVEHHCGPWVFELRF